MLTNFHQITALCAGAATLMLSACDQGVMSTDMPSYRLKTTVEIDTPEGVRRGYAVSEHHMNIGRLRSSEISPLYGSVVGEAVVVDLPNDEALFMINQCSEPGQACSTFGNGVIPYETLPGYVETDIKDGYAENVRTAKKSRQAIADAVGTSAVMPIEYYPMMVRFADPAKPETVEEVDPVNLVASFGEGYAIRRISVEITDAPVSKGIQKRFEWWNSYKDRYFDGTSTVAMDVTSKELASKLTSGTFTTEYNRK